MPNFYRRPKTIELMTPIRLRKLTRILRVNGVDVSIHWSVLLIAAVILSNAIRSPIMAVVGLLSYLSILLIHECGHLILAQRKHCEVYGIELYPIFAITRFETPWSRFDHCVIAWGGVLAQTVVAVPLVAWFAVFGATPFEPVNLVIAVLGILSLFIAAFNLLPFQPLDGTIAWGIIPEWIKQTRSRPSSRRPRWRGRP